MSPLKPEPALLCKLGSIAIHVEEFLSDNGHHFDLSVLRALLEDHEVKAWVEKMDGLALLPKKRKP